MVLSFFCSVKESVRKVIFPLNLGASFLTDLYPYENQFICLKVSSNILLNEKLSSYAAESEYLKRS